MINLKKPFTPSAPLPHRCCGGVGVLPWYRAEQRVRYFPDERLGGVEQKEFALSVLPKSHELVTWKGNTISAQCLGFLRGIFCLFCFVISSAGFCFVLFFPLKPLESLECVFLKAVTCRGLNPSFGSAAVLASGPGLALASSSAKSLTRPTWAEQGSAGPSGGLSQGQLCQHQSLLFLRFVSRESLHSCVDPMSGVRRRGRMNWELLLPRNIKEKRFKRVIH